MIIDQKTKQIIDAHFTKDYYYYGSICSKYFSGRYIYEDMLHRLYEEFLKVKPDVIIKFNEVNKLRNIGGRILISLYCKRNQGTKYKNKTTSELHEIPLVSEPKESISCNDEPSECKYEELDRAVSKLLHDNDTWFSTQVFIQCQEVSILELSKRTKISRDYLTRAYKKGNELLLKELI